MNLSIVIPVYNESRNIELLHTTLVHALQGFHAEIIYVNDGSTDSTDSELSCLQNHKVNKPHKIITFRRNFGQTAAMDAGFKAAKGDIVIAMDADLQNDPKDIKKLVDKIYEGYDVVSGWRRDRHDPLSKKIPSLFSNWLHRSLTGLRIHDSGCSLKAYRRECLKDLELYGEMHRFIPAILHWKGYRVGEVEVLHHQRIHGKTKYNWKRLVKGFLDLLVVKFWMQYSARPIHLFGGVGLLLFISGFVMEAYLALLKLFTGADLSNRPLLLLGILLIVLGGQCFMNGLLADILIKIYYRDRTSYSIKQVENG